MTSVRSGGGQRLSSGDDDVGGGDDRRVGDQVRGGGLEPVPPGTGGRCRRPCTCPSGGVTRYGGRGRDGGGTGSLRDVADGDGGDAGKAVGRPTCDGCAATGVPVDRRVDGHRRSGVVDGHRGRPGGRVAGTVGGRGGGGQTGALAAERHR